MEDRLESIARQIEEHIAILVDYDVIDVQVGDTLSQYVWSIVTESQDTPENLATVSKIGDSNEVHILGPLGLKDNWKTSKEDSGRS
jgi:hypothetical protein